MRISRKRKQYAHQLILFVNHQSFLKAQPMYRLKQHMYLNSNPYVSRKYLATVVLVVSFDASSPISNCNFSADWLDIPQTVYFHLVCVVSIRTPNRQQHRKHLARTNNRLK